MNSGAPASPRRYQLSSHRDDLFAEGEREEIAARYKQVVGFSQEAVEARTAKVTPT